MKANQDFMFLLKKL